MSTGCGKKVNIYLQLNQINKTFIHFVTKYSMLMSVISQNNLIMAVSGDLGEKPHPRKQKPEDRKGKPWSKRRKELFWVLPR